ncbi:MAG: DUF4417 domain-containing protein [Phycisphaerales bacterium]
MLKTTPLTVRGKLADPSLWHRDGGEIHLGCSQCNERELCGGLSIGAPVHNCLDLCCGNHGSCTRYACPLSVRRYAALVNEVGGLALRPYTKPVAPMLAVPDYVPTILDAGSLAGPLHIPVVAISLYKVIDGRTGLAKFSSRQELLAAFRIYSDAKVILTASAEDALVERFWEHRQSKATAESLKKIRPALIATPNFSMHAEAVRHDNLVSMARIAACFEDFASAGLPAALHVNGRTPHDFDRWAIYLNQSPWISVVSYEMGTMGRSSVRRAWHAAQLVRLARSVNRPLSLLIRGGAEHLTMLAEAFGRVVWTDTTAHMKAKKRQIGTSSSAAVSWRSSPTKAGEPIDELLLHNIRVYQRMTRALLPKRGLPPRELVADQLLLAGSLSSGG